MIKISLQGFINGNGIPQVNINKAQVAPTPTTHNPQSTAAAWDDKHQHYHNVLANGKIEGHMIECYLQVASRNISDPCVASREGSKKDRKVCHKSSCLFRFLIVGTGSLYWFLILDYVLITWIFTIIWSKLQYEVLSWKICSLSGCADKIFFNNMQGEDKNACYGDVWVFNPKNGTIGSDIDQNKNCHLLFIGQKIPILHE